MEKGCHSEKQHQRENKNQNVDVLRVIRGMDVELGHIQKQYPTKSTFLE